MDGELHYDFVDSTGAVVATIGVFLVADSPSDNPYVAQFFQTQFDGTPTQAPVGFDLWSVFPRDGFIVRARSSCAGPSRSRYNLGVEWWALPSQRAARTIRVKVVLTEVVLT
jgi:hypothetical protein